MKTVSEVVNLHSSHNFIKNDVGSLYFLSYQPTLNWKKTLYWLYTGLRLYSFDFIYYSYKYQYVPFSRWYMKRLLSWRRLYHRQTTKYWNIVTSSYIASYGHLYFTFLFLNDHVWTIHYNTTSNFPITRPRIIYYLIQSR